MENFSIVMVGAGNVATHLSLALQRAGYRISQVYSRTQDSARSLARRLECAYLCDIDQIDAHAGLYIVSVADDAIEELIPALTRRNPHALFVHTAGSVSSEVWKGYAVHYGVLYPLQTFSKQRPVNFSQVSFFIEASSVDDLQKLRQVAGDTGAKVYEADSRQRGYLHIAAVFACNFTNHLYAVSHRLMQEHGLPFEVLLPLIDETAGKVHTLPPVQAQTGPASRNDMKVLNQHLQMLAFDNTMHRLYELLSDGIRSYQKDAARRDTPEADFVKKNKHNNP